MSKNVVKAEFVYSEDEVASTINEFYGYANTSADTPKITPVNNVNNVNNTDDNVNNVNNNVNNTDDNTDDIDLTTHHGRASKYLQKTQEHYNNILVRLVSVTDVVLQEQLKEEHDIQAKCLQNAQHLCAMALLRDVVEEHTAKYESMFETADISNALFYSDTKKKVVLDDLTEKLRIRHPKSIADHRLLIIMCNALKFKLHIHDMEGYVVDTIGRGDIDVSVYIRMFSRFVDYDYSMEYETIIIR